MIEYFSKLLYLLDRKTRWQFVGLLFLLIGAALFETSGIGLVFPFISLINKPQLLYEQETLHRIHLFLGEPSTQVFLIWIGFAIVLFYIVKNAYLGITYHLEYRFLHYKHIDMASRLYETYLHSPYEFHLVTNSSTLIRNVNSDSRKVFIENLRQILIFIQEAVVMLLVSTLLFVARPLVFLITIAVIALIAGLFYGVFQRRMSEYGKAQREMYKKLYQEIQQGLGGIKEIQVLGREDQFVDRFKTHALPYAKSFLFLNTTQFLPRLVIEVVAVLTLIVVVLLFISQSQNLDAVLPLLALYAAATFRLLPASAVLLGVLNQIRFSHTSVDEIYDAFREIEARHLSDRVQSSETHADPPAAPRLQEGIRLENVSFQFLTSSSKVLEEVNLYIRAGEMVGFVGASGAGKTTLVDIILGLLEPDTGRVLVDGKDIRDGLSTWRAQVGYIPQEIFLTDDTLRANIALGIPDKRISDDQLWEAIHAAQIEEWVRSLPEGVNTTVGERGVRISGGQRQRVGIARALYHNPDVLIMDEATASLDNQTEAGVMQAVEALGGKKTLLIIAHRLSTVKNCDRLYLMREGRMVADGAYEKLYEQSGEFRDMVRLAELNPLK